MSFVHGSKRVFVFDETHNQSTNEVLEWLNLQALQEKDLFINKQRRESEKSNVDTALNIYEGPFLQIVPFGIGQFVFGSPKPPMNIG